MDKTDIWPARAVTTLEDLGRYLQQLRESKHVTQTGLSAKAAAISGYRISRSRISEIENARRDRVTERELRVYLLGLKCADRHIDQMVKTFRQCTTSAALVSINSATPTSDATGLDNTQDRLTPEDDQSSDDSIEDRERVTQSTAGSDSLNAYQFHPPLRRCHTRHIHIFAAMALVIAGFAGSNAEFSLRQKSASPTIPTRITPVSRTPVTGGNPSLLISVTSPDQTGLRNGNRPFQNTSLRRTPSADAESYDATKHMVKHRPSETGRRHAVDRVPLLKAAQDWSSYLDPWLVEPGAAQLMDYIVQ